MILNRRAGTSRRPAFTMIELLTVIAIVVVILGLGVGAFFRVRVSQEEKANETTVFKIQHQFDAQWRVVLDQAKEDAKLGKIPGFVNNLAGNDNRRALVIWTKIRLKLEFPTSFYEVQIWSKAMRAQYGVPTKSSYVNALGSILDTSLLDPSTVSTKDQRDQIMKESAALLFMSLSQSRGGITGFDPRQHIGPHAVGSVQVYGLDFPAFVDTWGKPIACVRWPLNAGDQSDLNQPPQQAKNNQGVPIDPQDPEQTLLEKAWAAAHTNDFKTIVGYDPTTPPAVLPSFLPSLVPTNLAPVICSSGRDKEWGIHVLLGPSPYPGDDPSFADDNIYGYRIAGVGRNN